MAREYLVKVFFLPLMASFYSNSLQTFERLVSGSDRMHLVLVKLEHEQVDDAGNC